MVVCQQSRINISIYQFSDHPSFKFLWKSKFDQQFPQFGGGAAAEAGSANVWPAARRRCGTGDVFGEENGYPSWLRSGSKKSECSLAGPAAEPGRGTEAVGTWRKCAIL